MELKELAKRKEMEIYIYISIETNMRTIEECTKRSVYCIVSFSQFQHKY